YPLSYTTRLDQSVEESRNEFEAFWVPFGFKDFQLSFNWRNYRHLETRDPEENEFWGALNFNTRHGNHRWWTNLDVSSNGSESLYGGFLLWYGRRIHTSIHLQAGKTWGNLTTGHNTYRIGGNVIEGYFTKRPTRLFPLRGFESNILEAGQAVTSGIEVFWPLANIQKGYKTLPLFLHRLRLGTFVDAGMSADDLAAENLLMGAGFELITSMEIAWGNLSSFRMGVAWPIRQPDYLNEEGPVFLIQLGRPL
ncbi:hypothetical protein ACFL9U_16325, partial [Thermodesulfobacteriota bacterium]